MHQSLDHDDLLHSAGAALRHRRRFVRAGDPSLRPSLRTVLAALSSVHVAHAHLGTLPRISRRAVSLIPPHLRTGRGERSNVPTHPPSLPLSHE